MLCNPYNEGLRPFQNSLKLCPSLIVENNWKGGEKQSGDGAAGLQCKHFAEDRELQLLHCRCIVDALWEIVVDRVACLHLGHRYSQPPQVTLWLRSQKYPVAVASNFPRLMMHKIFLLFTRENNRDAVIMHSIISPRYPESASIIVVLSICCPHFSMNFLSHSLVIEHNYVT